MAGSTTGCHGLLDVSDPSYIRDQDVANATGANARRVNAVINFMAYLPQTFSSVGLFTDELTYDSPPQSGVNPDKEFDRRSSDVIYTDQFNTDDSPLANFAGYLGASSLAIPQVRLYSPDSVKGDYLAQLYAFRGYTILQMAEVMCPGFPINDVSPDNLPLLSGPYTTDSAITYAIAQLDSALANVHDSVLYAHFAHVVKARALLDVGNYSAAAAEVATVPSNFVFRSDPTYGTSFTSYDNGNGTFYGNYPMADHEGGVGLGFLSERDTIRAPYGYFGQRATFPADSLFVSRKYPYGGNTTVVFASGTEARLIEAEVALHNGSPTWLTILNALRAPVQLAPLTDPVDPDARVDLVYHERAFWLYLTGRRLGDLRRLLRNYGRTASSTYPTGAYLLGGTYGTETAIGFNVRAEGQYNSNITTGCTSH